MGKRRSRLNAAKHGLSAETVLLNGESPAEFNEFVQGFRRDFRSVGTVENLLVDELAILKWRARRVLIAEKADIELQMDSLDDFGKSSSKERTRLESNLQ